jgi:hypothetical protein
VPHDIPSTSPARDIQPEGESPKVVKPPSSSAGKPPPKTLNPPISKGTCVPTGASSNPSSPPVSDSQHDATRQSPRPNLARPQDASPISLKLFELRAHGGQQSDDGPSVPRSGKQPRQIFACCRVPMRQPGLHLGWVPHRSIRVSSYEYPSRTRIDQGPLLQHAEYLRAYRRKFPHSTLPSYLEA